MPKLSWALFGALFVRCFAAFLLLLGLILVVAGGYLLSIGGTPYYLLAGLGICVSAFYTWRRRIEGALAYFIVFFATMAWALWEVGFDGWALMPRIVALFVIGAVFLIPLRGGLLSWRAKPVSTGAIVATMFAILLLGVAARLGFPPATPSDPIFQAGTIDPAAISAVAGSAGDDHDWKYYGGDAAGTRFSSAAQLTPENVGNLKPAWSFDLGPVSSLEVTPLKIGDSVYVCNDRNDVIALDAETGALKWRFDAGVDTQVQPNKHCRGVAFYKVPQGSGACAERILTNTIDARLIALDALSGRRCAGFGTDGEVSLKQGMGEVLPGYYLLTSAPTIVRGKIVLGGMVLDNMYWGEPSGVIRAFDAVTGKLSWAWDMGHPDWAGEPPRGQTYTLSTPNSWAPMSADEDLGLVYVPTGNSSPDIFGGLRRPFDDRYASSVVALDAETGRPRWSFQTVHHDVWDYDVASQPSLIDFNGPSGPVHALVQPTKRGEVFVLDRVTGKPVFPVRELPVPQKGAVPEEHLSPTQPYSVALPSFRGPNLVERDMWGITPLDQLWCRIKFREARYEGPLTPPGLTPAILWPGPMGGMNWGSAAIDKDRDIVIAPTNSMPIYPQLLTRAEANRRGLKRMTVEAVRQGKGEVGGAQEGTPYGASLGWGFLSPLTVPCKRPPYGYIHAFHLSTGKLIWTKSFGSGRDLGPLGSTIGLPAHLGAPNAGGAAVTRGGVFFIGATGDRYLRAYETLTGKQLWQADLPSSAHSTPMTYISEKSGRQFVVVAAGGHGVIPGRKHGGVIAAFALPTAPAASRGTSPLPH